MDLLLYALHRLTEPYETVLLFLFYRWRKGDMLNFSCFAKFEFPMCIENFAVVHRSVVSSSLPSHGLQHSRFPVLHHLPELAPTHIHWVSDAIQPSHPLLSPYPPAFNLSQHQGFSQRVSSLNQVAKVLELQLQHQFFQWIFRINSRARVWTKETDSRELCVILSYFASGILLRKKLK